MWNPFKKKPKKVQKEERPQPTKNPHIKLPHEAAWLDDSIKVNLRSNQSDEEILRWFEIEYRAGLEYADIVPGAKEKLEYRRQAIEELKAKIAASKDTAFGQHEDALNGKPETRSPKYKTDQEMMEAYGRASYTGYTTGRWDEAKRVFHDLEEAGFCEASVALAQLAQTTNKAAATSHYKKIADRYTEGSWGYAANLGHGYVADIEGKDKEWYHYCMLAAKYGSPDAMNELGNMYNRKGHFLGAFYWYYMAAFYEHHQGWAGVLGELQKWQENGMPNLEDSIDGVSKSEVLSVKHVVEALRDKNLNILILLHLALEDDNEFAGLFIGHMCEQENDWEKAKQGYQVAAHNPKSVMAKKCLADMLAFGKGCQRDMANALDWYKEAAEMGEKSAMFIYGQFVAQKNPAEGVYWLACAFRRGYDPALDYIQKKIKM